jgi:predicted nuclease of predicted toxin-antitoxin system
MKILADESVDRPIVERLRELGYVVDYIAEIDPSIVDRAVLEIANSSRALLLTADKDFGELVYRDHHETADGIVLLRLAGLTSEEKAQKALDAIHDFRLGNEMRFMVVTKAGVRFRS